MRWGTCKCREGGQMIDAATHRLVPWYCMNIGCIRDRVRFMYCSIRKLDQNVPLKQVKGRYYDKKENVTGSCLISPPCSTSGFDQLHYLMYILKARNSHLFDHSTPRRNLPFSDNKSLLSDNMTARSEQSTLGSHRLKSDHHLFSSNTVKLVDSADSPHAPFCLWGNLTLPIAFRHFSSADCPPPHWHMNS